ncbi:MAG: hypothetical protein HKN58_00660 [Xanthomonadales bacterium]|nr:hypothetical protein [Xanthomonadales bacterium]
MKRPQLKIDHSATPVTARTLPAPKTNRYAPAYSYGWSEHLRRGCSCWAEHEEALRQGWSQVAASADLDWEEAREAVRDGWEHVNPNRFH